MGASLGEKIGEGGTADIHVWAPGQVVKLFRAHISSAFGRHEARTTRAAFAAGAPAPEVLDEVMLEGRFGFVMPRLDGPTLLQRLLSGAVTHDQAGAVLARLYANIHALPAPPEVAAMNRPMPLSGSPASTLAPASPASTRADPGTSACARL